MKYVGEFTSLYDKRYKVEIITNYDTTQTKEITLAADPVTITTESDGLFAPIKSRSCSITIVSNEVYFDMYAASAKQNTVTVYKQWVDPENPNNKGWEVFFEGYVTPGVYDQSWTYMDQFTIECCDKLSILQYYKYEYDDYVNKGEQQLSLKHLILKCLNVAEYSNTYFRFPKYSSMYSRTDDTCFLDLVTVSEANFFDDDDEHTPWTYEDVLTEICNFLGVSCCVWHEMIYFVDYQLINQYDKQMGSETWENLGRYYGFSNSTYGYMELSENPITLTKDDMMGNKPSLSLDAVYNKISVSCSLYDYGDGDAESLGSTILNYDDMTNLMLYYDYSGGKHEKWEFNTTFISKDTLVSYVAELKAYRPTDYIKTGKWSWRYFESNLYNGIPNDPELYGYTTYDNYTNPVYKRKRGEYSEIEAKRWFWSNLTNKNGVTLSYEDYTEENIKNRWALNEPKLCFYKNVAVPMRYGTFKRNSTDLSYNWGDVLLFTPVNRNLNHYNYLYSGKTITCSKSEFENKSTEEKNKALEVLNTIIRSNIQPNLTFEDTADIRYSPNSGIAYFTFYAELLYICDHKYREGNTVYDGKVWVDANGNNFNSILPPCEIGYTEQTYYARDYGNIDFNKGWNMVKLEVSCGGKYWNGSSWQDSQCTFWVSYHKNKVDASNSKGDIEQEKFCMFDWMKPVTNADPKMTIENKDRYVIPITPEDNIFGKLKVVLYTPKIHTDFAHAFPDWNAKLAGVLFGTLSLIQTGELNVYAFPQHIFMKDLEFTYEYSTEDYDSTEEESNDDIVYSNVINESYVEEYDDLELKINTQVDKKPQSRSYALDARTTEYVHNLYCPATGHNYRPEENLIEKLYNHYSTPKKIFDMKSIFNDELHPASPVIYTSISDKPLCVDSQEIHLANDTNDIKLIEF